MKRGFYTIMAAQFFSSLADNALLVAAIELLKSSGAPEWQQPALLPMFAVFYVVLAPFLGAFADSRPKGQVMFVSNAIKVVGCAMMLFGSHPLLAYAVVGLGAAAYSPAKYGILTELLPPSQLIKANGWIEGLTIGSIIMGILLGGQLIRPVLAQPLLHIDVPFIDTCIDTPAQAAIAVLIFIYALAAWFNTRIPLTGVPMRPMPRNWLQLLPDFWRCNARLWSDKLGQISLAATTLIWGVTSNLRVLIFAWSAVALGYGTSQASSLTGVVALGMAVGAIWASMRMKLDRAVGVLPLGIVMGLVVLVLNVIDNVWMAVPFFILLGALGGFLVVPMNALLQHRGHNLMGAGRSIAVQNFNEQACVLAMGALYSASVKGGLSAYGAITGCGVIVAAVMGLIYLWRRRNMQRWPDEMHELLTLARSDPSHG